MKLQRITDHWQARLPKELLEHVTSPVRIEEHHDASVPPSKWRGYDLQGELCCYRHHFLQWDASLDGDDDLLVSCLLRKEDLEAWRTHHGTWVRQIQRIEGDGQDDGAVKDLGFARVDLKCISRL